MGYRVTEIPGTSGRCESEGCSRRCCQCRGGAGTPGQLEGPCWSVSWRRAQGALWLPRPPFGKAVPGSGPGRVVLRRDLSLGSGAAAKRDRPVRAGQGTDRAPPRGWGQVPAGARPDPGLGPGNWIRAGGGGGRPGCAGSWRGPCGSVRAAAGAGRTARGRQGAITGRDGSGGGVSLPAPPGPAPAAPPRPRDSPVPPSRGVPVPPGAQRGPDPAAPGIDVLPPGPTVGLGLTRGLQWGGCPGARCATRGAAALVRESTGASPARSPSVSRAVGLGGSSHGNQPVKEPLVAMETGPGVTLAVALGAEGIQQLSRPPCGLWGHRAVGHEPWTRLCGAAA